MDMPCHSSRSSHLPKLNFILLILFIAILCSSCAGSPARISRMSSEEIKYVNDFDLCRAVRHDMTSVYGSDVVAKNEVARRGLDCGAGWSTRMTTGITQAKVSQPRKPSLTTIIVGTWKVLIKGARRTFTQTINSDFSCSWSGAPDNECRWTLEDPVQRRYRFDWEKGPSNTMTLSPDGSQLEGIDTLGNPLILERQL